MQRGINGQCRRRARSFPSSWARSARTCATCGPRSATTRRSRSARSRCGRSSPVRSQRRRPVAVRQLATKLWTRLTGEPPPPAQKAQEDAAKVRQGGRRMTAEATQRPKAPQPQPEHQEPKQQDPTLGSLSKRDYVAIIKRAFKEMMDDNLPALAAALAYYAFLAIPSALLLAAGTFSLLAGPDAVNTIVDALSKVMPAQAVDLVSQSLTNLTKKQCDGDHDPRPRSPACHLVARRRDAERHVGAEHRVRAQGDAGLRPPPADRLGDALLRAPRVRALVRPPRPRPGARDVGSGTRPARRGS